MPTSRMDDTTRMPSQARPPAPTMPVRYGPYLVMPSGYLHEPQPRTTGTLLSAEEFQALMAVASGAEPLADPPH